MELLTARPESAPPKVVISEEMKPLGASLNVKVMVAVPPESRVSTLLVMARVGAAVSKVSVGVEPAPPELPAASAYRPLTTVMLAVPELVLGVGVKVAV